MDDRLSVRLPAGAARALLAVSVLAVVGYGAATLWLGGAKVAAALARVPTTHWLAVIGLSLLNYGLRGARWRAWLASLGHPLPAKDASLLYLAGYSFTPTPGNVGEALRGVLLVRYGVPAGHALAVFVAERLTDLLALLLMALPALAWLPLPAGMGWWVLAAGMIGLLVLWFGRGWLMRRLPTVAAGLACLRHRPVAWLLVSLVAWAAQGAGLALLAAPFGAEAGVWQSANLYAAAMVGGALSMLPAGLGGTEALLGWGLSHFGLSWADAAAVTLLARVLTLWLAVGLGLFCLGAWRVFARRS